MKTRVKKSTWWTLVAGVVLGAAAMASVLKTNVITTAHADPQGTLRPVAGINAANMEALRNLDASFASLAEFVEPSVVHIRAESKTSKDMLGRAMPMGGEGSGVIYRPDGWILTNDHVVNGFEKVTVVLNDGREFPGKVTRAEDSDLAVVKIEAKDLPAATFSDSAKVRAGQFAIAVGSPFGLENTVTIGHVSALGRTNEVPDQRVNQQVRYYPDMIQTDASINMGNSGGPLLNVDGQVIGINTAIYSGTGGSVGIGFAIPANQARLIADMLIEKGKITRGYLGLVPLNLKEFQKKDWKLDGGALVDQLPNDGPAAMAGIKKGDVIVRIGDSTIRNQIDVRNAMLRYAPGSSVDLEVIRDGQHKTVSVKVGTPPKNLIMNSNPNGGQTPNQRQFNFNGQDFPDMNDLIPKNFGQDGDQNGDVAPLHEGKAKLGVGIQSVDEAARKQYHIGADVEGALVTSVESGSVADAIGLKIGDVVRQIGDKQIKSGADLVDAMKGVNWGDTKTLRWTRFTSNGMFDQTRPVTFK